MENTSPASTPAIVHIELSICVAQSDSFCRDPNGRADFRVDLPIASFNAVNLNVLLPSLVKQAKANFLTKLAEMEAEAKEMEGE